MIGLSNAGVEMTRQNGDFNIYRVCARNKDKGRVHNLMNPLFSYANNTQTIMSQSIKQVSHIRYQHQRAIHYF